MPFLPDPPDLLAIATRIAAHADAARVEAARLSASVGAITWSGLAASAFEAPATEVTADLHRTADQLDAAAAALRRHAYAVQETLDDLRRLGGDVLGAGRALGHGLVDEFTHPGRLLGDGVGLAGIAAGAVHDVGDLIGLG